MNILHVLAGLGEASGVANIARRFARLQAESENFVILCAPGASTTSTPLHGVKNDCCVEVERRRECTWKMSWGFGFIYFSWGMLFNLPRMVKGVDEVWVHCSWTFPVWYGAWLAKRQDKKLVVVPEGSFDPKRLCNHAGWKKRFVAPLDCWVLRQADEVLALCHDEIAWVRAFEPAAKVHFAQVPIFQSDTVGKVKSKNEEGRRVEGGPLHVLFLGRAEDPLKGVQYLEQAVKELNHRCSSSSFTSIELRLESSLFGEAKEKAWEWCDVFCLPTLSENFGLVVAEAIEHGKPVITTDGAPAWKGQKGIVYLVGYRNADSRTRVSLLKHAILEFLPPGQP